MWLFDLSSEEILALFRGETPTEGRLENGYE